MSATLVYSTRTGDVNHADAVARIAAAARRAPAPTAPVQTWHDCPDQEVNGLTRDDAYEALLIGW